MNKVRVRKNFSKAASSYKKFSDIQKISANQLIAFINRHNIKFNNRKILDIGSGDGYISQIINKDNFIVNFDISNLMLNSALIKKDIVNIQGDMDFLPFDLNYFDIIISNFALQWSSNNLNLIQDILSNLTRGKILIFALPNNNSLKELRNVRSELKCNFYLKKLPDHFLILDSINNIQSLFSENYHHEEIYHNPVQALKKIKKIGANYSNNLTTNINKSMLLKLLQYNNSDNKNFILSWDISYFLCIK